MPLDVTRARYDEKAPVGGAIDMSLSFRMTMRRSSRAPALFMAS